MSDRKTDNGTLVSEHEKSFRDDIEAVLKKHGAEFILTDDGGEYGTHSPVLEVEFKDYRIPDFNYLD